MAAYIRIHSFAERSACSTLSDQLQAAPRGLSGAISYPAQAKRSDFDTNGEVMPASSESLLVDEAPQAAPVIYAGPSGSAGRG